MELFSAGLSGPSQPVTLIGFSSEEGDPGSNARLTEARIDAVARILIRRGHDGAAITRIPRPSASRGRIQYRQWRAVEMLTGGAGQSLVPDYSRQGPSQAFGGTEARDYRQDLARAANLVRETARELRTGRLSGNTRRAVRRLFGTAADLPRIADSYALLVMLGHGVVGLPSSAPPEDDVSALPARLRRPVGIAIAYMQRWITSATDVSQWLYELINNGIAARRWTSRNARREMRYVAGQFGISFNARRPRDRDRSAMAAIYDRISIMRRFLRDHPLRFTASSADTVWESGPGPHVAVAPSLGRRPLISRIRLLLRRLATATRDIRRGLESAYVNVADRFRQGNRK